MNLQAAYGLLAYGLIFGALSTLLPLGDLRPRAALAATAIALLAGIAPWLNALFGPPSIPLLAIAIHAQRPLGTSLINPHSALALLLTGLMLYASLPLTGFDLYALGFQPRPLLAALLPLGLGLWLGKCNQWLMILILALLAYGIGLFANLWQALIDPLLLLLALSYTLRRRMINGLAAKANSAAKKPDSVST